MQRLKTISLKHINRFWKWADSWSRSLLTLTKSISPSRDTAFSGRTPAMVPVCETLSATATEVQIVVVSNKPRLAPF